MKKGTRNMKNLTLENITRVCRGTYHEILQSLARRSPV